MIIAYQILNCGYAVIVYEEDGERTKIIDKVPNLEELRKSEGEEVSKMEDIDNYLL